MVASTSFSPEVQDQLQAVAPTFLEMEQYMDFLRNRMFRQTIVCHEWLRPKYEVRSDRLAAFQVVSSLRPAASDPDLDSDSPVEFTAGSGMSLTSPIPIVKAALTCLGEIWPQAVAFGDLPAVARSRLAGPAPEDPTADSQALGRALLTAYASADRRLVELWVRPPAFATAVGARPMASRLVRLQAAGANQVTSLRHERVNLTPLETRLLRLLDGTRERADLPEALLESFREGELGISQGGQPVTEPAEVRRILADVIDECLPRLARAALLLA
jgi:methyltransferase-like protein